MLKLIAIKLQNVKDTVTEFGVELPCKDRSIKNFSSIKMPTYLRLNGKPKMTNCRRNNRFGYRNFWDEERISCLCPLENYICDQGKNKGNKFVDENEHVLKTKMSLFCTEKLTSK